MEDALREVDFRKLTGPIEHWLTTFHTGFWGFRPDKREAWEEIDDGEVFLFHASGCKFLDVQPKEVRDAGKGVIGIGRVGAKSRKDEPVWWQEVHKEGDYPYLVHFSEIHWFADTNEIRDAPVKEKSIEGMVSDVHRLSENKITFGEMRERTGYQIPPQGSPTNINQPEKLFPLLRERISGQTGASSDGSEADTAETNSDGRTTSSVRSRNREREFGTDEEFHQTITYKSSINETINGWLEHEDTLDIFEDYLIDRGFETGETEHSDILAWREANIILGEAKAIHDENERAQIRRGLGQLFEYSYFDVAQNSKRNRKQLTRCLVLSRAPSEDYQAYLRDLQKKGIYTYWTDEYEVRGLSESMERLRGITD